MEGPHIRLDIGQDTHVESSISNFEQARQAAEAIKSPLSSVFNELARSEVERKIIDDALVEAGKGWNDIVEIQDPALLKSFGALLAHWDTPVEGNPKTEEQHKEEVMDFVKKI